MRWPVLPGEVVGVDVLAARLAPSEGDCCVRLDMRAARGGERSHPTGASGPSAVPQPSGGSWETEES